MTDIQSWLRNQQKTTKLKRFDLELLLLGALNAERLKVEKPTVDRSWLFSHDDEHLNQAQTHKLAAWVEQAQAGKPIAYILGHKAFWTLDLLVSSDTLIPRPETEQIIELALELSAIPKRALDLGTGTGAIALSLAKEWPLCEILACDFSQAALSIAQQNAEKNHIKNVSFFHSDWFSNLSDGERFGLIVSNPPYIDPNDEHLKALTYEPISALTAENNGLKDLESIIVQAKKFLLPQGHLIVEHGYDQGKMVRNLLSASDYQAIFTHKDLAGHDRITTAQKSSQL